MENLTPEELEAILGTDYETILAEALRRKGGAEGRASAPMEQIGQVGDGNVFFDPAGAVRQWNDRRVARKDAASAGGDMQKILDQQKAGRKVFAEALLRKPAEAPMPGSEGAGDPLAQTVGPAPSAAPTPPAAAPGPTQAPPPSPPPAPVPPAPPGARNEPLRGPQRMGGGAPAAAGLAGGAPPGFLQALLAKLRGG